MNRRHFLQGSLGAALASPFLARAADAQTPAPFNPRTSPPPRKLVLDISSRSLQWLRTPEDIAKAAVELVVGGVSPTVLPAPGHIDPARVGQQLPAFVKAMKDRGLRVSQLRGPAIADLTDARADALLGAASQSGLTHYSLGGFTYDLKKPLGPQIDAIKLRLTSLVRLNEKHRMTLAYHTVAGADAAGGVVLDLLPVMKLFSPKYIGFQWDTGHMALHADGMWETLMRLAGPYIASVAWRDRGWTQELGLLGEGGPYTGPVPRVEPLVTQPDGTAIPGTPAPPGAAGRAGGGGGRGRAAGAGDGEDAPAAAAGRRGGGGPPQGPANSAGAGSIDANNPLFRSRDGEMPKRPIGGKNVKGAGWSAPNVIMGTGVVHIPHVVDVLADLGFNGPSEVQSEYIGLGGAETGADTINRPRQWVLGMLKRDVITIRKSFEMANRGITI